MKAFTRLIAAAVAVLGATATHAQDFPTRPIRLVVPFSAGGPTDVTARAIAQKMGSLLGQQMVVENRTGAGGILGNDMVAKAPADGYTLLFGTFSMAIAATLQPSLPYDTLHDFAPVGQIANTYLALTTPANFPARTVQDFIALAKVNPEKITYGSAGIGSGMHFASEMFLSQAKLKGVTHVPFRGNSMVVPALLAGDVTYSFLGMDTALPHVRSGRLRALAVTSPQRDPLLPDVPTVAESGIPGFEASIWFVLQAPKNTPAPIVKRLNAALNQALESDEMRKMARSVAGMVLMPSSTPESTQAFIRDEITRWAPIIKASGAKPE